MEDNQMRVRLTPELLETIEDHARRLKLKPQDVARMAIAEGMRVLLGQPQMVTIDGRPALSDVLALESAQLIEQSWR